MFSWWSACCADSIPPMQPCCERFGFHHPRAHSSSTSVLWAPCVWQCWCGTSRHMHSSSFFLTVLTRASSFCSWVPFQSGSMFSPLLSTSGPICCLYAAVLWYPHQKEQRGSPYGCPVELTRAGTGLQGFFFFPLLLRRCGSELAATWNWLWIAGYLVG